MNSPLLIYKIVNDVNDNVYVGYTATSLQKRFSWHIRDAKTGHKKKLYNAMRKLGIDNFGIKLIEECWDEAQLKSREEYYITFYDSYENGYNASSKSCGIMRHSKRSREKMRKAKLGKKLSESHKLAISKGQQDRDPSTYVIPNNKGRKHTEKFKEVCRNRTQKEWIITHPGDRKEKIINLRKFCIDNELSIGCMWEIAHNKHGRTQHKGYKVMRCV